VSINDAGDWAFSTNTDAPVATDEAVVRVIGGVGGTFIPVAIEGSPVTGGAAGLTWGATLESVTITPGSDITLTADGLGGAAAGQNEILWVASSPFATTGVIAPTGQLGTETWENFGGDDFWWGPSGHWLVRGDLSTFRLGIPLGRVADANDVTQVVLFLLSSRARHVTMQDLTVDGGATC
jgi:hypothetical protein